MEVRTTDAPSNVHWTKRIDAKLPNKVARNRARGKDRLGCHATKQGFQNFVANSPALVAETLPITHESWHGRVMQVVLCEAIIAQWSTWTIMKVVQTFQKIPFSFESLQPTHIFDSKGRLIMYCSMAFNLDMKEFVAQAKAFMVRCSPFSEDAADGNSRGRHWFCIAGHDRQNKMDPALTASHRKNWQTIQDFFQPTRIFYRATLVHEISSSLLLPKSISMIATSLVWHHFPQIYQRYYDCALYMQEKEGLLPLFGIFWNFCINVSRPGVKRVYCRPHVDRMNIAIGVCVVFVYGKFNHKEKCWLCIWEFGFVTEIPPNVFCLYPSSLLFHFNIDMSQVNIEDVEIKVTDRERPTKDSDPVNRNWKDEEERGSCMWFSQATMFQSSEKGIRTMKDA
ncbi:hypothetical protein ARMGADRAFT_1078972 [Armillaria gallica]|uniref:Uncharacterized protein n=1 Tax=Armillaria gallica TaxID=47427 RepID=A0A2H3E153_ARMGA|nr:hypothetical protein ARMGADRAFT_1078972 [Armillaria gallica]